MDVAMPGMNGIEATRQIKANSPETAVLALTMHEDEQYFFAMLGAGASGYIPKRAAPDDLVSAPSGSWRRAMSFSIRRWRAFLMKDIAEQKLTATSEDDGLTAREIEVLTCIAEGMTNREIAEALVISIKTVERHRENIMAKLDMHNRVELVKYAIRRGLIQPE